MTERNVDDAEIAKFEALASRWWDPTSEFKPLHDINPLRANWIDRIRQGRWQDSTRRRLWWRAAVGGHGLARRHRYRY